ncbi:hypothetical protein [Rhodococcus koreensis]
MLNEEPHLLVKLVGVLVFQFDLVIDFVAAESDVLTTVAIHEHGSVEIVG